MAQHHYSLCCTYIDSMLVVSLYCRKHKHHERENSRSVSPVCDTGSDKKRRKSKKKRSKHSPDLERSPDVPSDS